MTIVGRLDLPAGHGIPLTHGPIRRASRKVQTIPSERHAEHFASVPSTEGGHRTGGWVPETCHAILAASREARAVRAEGKGPGAADFLGRGRHWFARIGVVHREIPLLRAYPGHCQPQTVRADGDQIGVRSCRPPQLCLDAPLVVQDVQHTCVLRCVLRETDRRGTTLPDAGEKPQSVPGEERGMVEYTRLRWK